MTRLSTLSLRRIGTTWTALLALALSVLLSANLTAQSPSQDHPKADSSFAELQRAAASEAENGNIADAIRDTQRALEMQPEWKEGWWNLGMLQYEANQYAEAAH